MGAPVSDPAEIPFLPARAGSRFKVAADILLNLAPTDNKPVPEGSAAFTPLRQAKQEQAGISSVSLLRSMKPAPRCSFRKSQ